MNPLQDLKDIHPPSTIESWPPAYGWWLLGIFSIIGVSLIIMWFLSARNKSLAKRQALKSLQQIDASNSDSVSQLNQLLKRVAMTYFPNQNVRELHGPQWTNFIVNTLPKNKIKDFSEPFESMQQMLYRAQTSENASFARYYKLVETWIKYALPPRKKVIQQLEQNNA